MAVEDFDSWLQAQNCLLGTALIDAEFIPRLVQELRPEDFTGAYREIYKAIGTLFRESVRPADVDPVCVLSKIGNTAEHRQLIADLMGSAAYGDAIERYMKIVRGASRLSQLRELGRELSGAVDLSEALDTADRVNGQLMERTDVQVFDPDDLETLYIEAENTNEETMPFPIRGLQGETDVTGGDLLLIGAEPSGGKTLFALQLLLEVSKTKRVMFVSLETKPLKLYRRLLATAAKVPLKAIKRKNLTKEQQASILAARQKISKQTFRIVPASVNTVQAIKAAAVSYRADVVIIDYLQLIQTPGNGSRYEKVTEISMALHIMAQTTGMVVIPLSQVTNRSPELRNKPLDMHSSRESGQIEADCDVIFMLDKYVEKGLTESGCRANRILRCVKNKEGELFRMPLILDGVTQTFSRAYVPNPDWERAAEEKKRKQQEAKAKKGIDPEQQSLPEITGEDKNLPFN